MGTKEGRQALTPFGGSLLVSASSLHELGLSIIRSSLQNIESVILNLLCRLGFHCLEFHLVLFLRGDS
jgi:hypothetical protein